ncbi:Putative Thr operon leader peptide [Serratia symbiotica SCt-VLC]|uniref:thr operon leader peptide n=1 Tax=Serratia symbiotica SCt-VLC TaxID=1347341 RepID=A0A068RBL5_9GAMM|nr:Putative Thr operon leader peptide [Serratia symbiotica SCt-VLC]
MQPLSLNSTMITTTDTTGNGAC